MAALPFSLESARIVISPTSRVVVFVDGLNIDAMPTESISLLQSGKASIKPLPAARISEMHRDNICSATLRVAFEILRALPIDSVEVVAAVDLLDHASGNFERCPVAYLKTTPAALATVNLARAEAFPLFERLGGTIDWQRRLGLRAISTDDFDLPDEPDE